MLHTLFLISFLCGLTLLSVSLEYRARAETSLCLSPPRGECPDTKPPDCEREKSECPKSFRIITE